MASLLADIRDEVENGRGFMLMRGFPRARYSDADCELVYWGLGMHLGTPVSQNARGHLLGHVRDEGGSIADPNTRAYQTNMRMDFHTDMLPIEQARPVKGYKERFVMDIGGEHLTRLVVGGKERWRGGDQLRRGEIAEETGLKGGERGDVEA